MNHNIQRLSILTSIVMFSVLLLATQQLSEAANAEEIQTSPVDSVGDIHVRSTFDINGYPYVVDNFKVFDQKLGFNAPSESKTPKPTVEIWGAPDYTHMMLYEVADVTHYKGQSLITATDVEFDVLFEIYQGDMVFRTFEYHDCMITNYVFTTLHDGEETFSGLTQFVYADVFQLECGGYFPGSPLQGEIPEKADNESSADWQLQQRSTWTEEFR